MFLELEGIDIFDSQCAESTADKRLFLESFKHRITGRDVRYLSIGFDHRDRNFQPAYLHRKGKADESKEHFVANEER